MYGNTAFLPIVGRLGNRNTTTTPKHHVRTTVSDTITRLMGQLDRNSEQIDVLLDQLKSLPASSDPTDLYCALDRLQDHNLELSRELNRVTHEALQRAVKADAPVLREIASFDLGGKQLVVGEFHHEDYSCVTLELSNSGNAMPPVGSVPVGSNPVESVSVDLDAATVHALGEIFQGLASRLDPSTPPELD